MSEVAVTSASRGTCPRRRPIRYRNKKRSVILVVIALLAISGCSSPAKRIDTLSESLGFARAEVVGKDFVHVIYSRDINDSTGPLHVYIEGDGSAWRDRTTVSRDPTPNNPLMLELMALDHAPSLYLGRPCYFGTARQTGCEPVYWTTRRFSESVVASMAAALDEATAVARERQFVLVGHSGGGTLAMLLAQRLARVKAVVTLAGNLDVEAWTAHHGYSPLTGSLNPVEFGPLQPQVLQIHYAGGQDQLIPARLIRDAAQTTGGRYVLYEQFDHACCWSEVWPSVLEQLATLD